MLGIAGENRATGTLALTHTKGTMVEVASMLAKASRALAIYNGEADPDARAAGEAFGIKNPLFYERDVRAAIALTIAYYNQFWTDHRMEGFRDVAVEKPGGGRAWRKESPNEKAARLEMELGDKRPVRISAADTCLMMQKAKNVTVKPNGVVIEINKQRFRFWKDDSLACYEAQRLTGHERKYVAIFDSECPTEIYLLRNKASDYPDKKEFEFVNAHGLAVKRGDAPEFLEALPLAEAPENTDMAAMSKRRGEIQQQHNTVAREVARGIEPLLLQREQENQTNLQKLIHVVTTTGGDQRQQLPESSVTQEINAVRSRREEQPIAQSEYDRLVKQHALPEQPVTIEDESEPEII